ncbi:hypothetical protein U5N28_15630 [Lysinibacillus telephonicus]|uniref:Uncharacterized protein n=1 Tax=Lysinibacillus telephonicus TaxID=1714840 RepID=A0A3S0HCP9_9BACI|nr:hypothetical protein [Lysinibacillus telephonicus]RTQ86941.1 hypothetical protein EKG35_19610 [Lysinibacillus telephonicus]
MIKGILIGASFGAVLSVCFSFIFMFIGQGIAGGYVSFWGESWLYFAALFPCVITFIYLSTYFFRIDTPSNKKMWILSFFVTLFLIWYISTLGALTGEYIVRGLIQKRETIGVNELGTLGWGSVYALILTPILTPINRLLLELFYNILTKFKATKSSLN